MKNIKTIASDLFDKIRGRFPSVTIGDENGKVTNMPEEARFYDFTYNTQGMQLGKVSIGLDEENGVTVIVGRDIVGNESEEVQDNWYGFLREIRQFAKKRMMKFDVRDINKSNLSKKDYEYMANARGETQMAESKMYGTNKTSYQRVGNARVAIRHTAPIGEGESRLKNIGSIFIESPEGEKFKYPVKHLQGARALALHVSEGGHAYDDFGKYITGLSEELSSLGKFKTYMNRKSVMAEALQGYMGVVETRVKEVRKEISNLQKPNYYAETIDGWSAPLKEDVPVDVEEAWIDQLTVKQFKEDIADVFPYIYNLIGEGSKATELGPEDLIDEASNGIEAMKKAGNAKADAEAKERAKKDKSVDESGLQYHTGVKKHGKEYMVKAAQAGRDGASQQELGALKDKYSKAEKNKKTKEDIELESAFNTMMGQFAEGKDCDDCNCSPCECDTQEEGNAFAHAVRQAKMNGKKKGDKVKGPSGDEITLEKQKTPIGEFILSYFDRENGTFPKGETAVLTMVEKDYGDRYVEPAAKFIQKVESMVSQRQQEDLANTRYPETDMIKALAGL